MSNIGKQPILVPDGVEVSITDNHVVVKGKLGELSQQFDGEMDINLSDSVLTVSRPTDEKKHRELHGLTRILIYNMVTGVTEGFQKELNLVGVGYTADASKGNFLLLNIGYSHPIYFEKPEGITFETPNQTTILIKGNDKQAVGQVAAKIRELRKPEPYKGKGIKYANEFIRRKAGKSIGAIV